jgi:hypothetical protein
MDGATLVIDVILLIAMLTPSGSSDHFPSDNPNFWKSSYHNIFTARAMDIFFPLCTLTDVPTFVSKNVLTF